MPSRKIPFDRITTRAGDEGNSTLYNGERRPKDDLVFHVLGDLDELNSFLGWVKAESQDLPYLKDLESLQLNLFRIGAEVATPPSDPRFHSLDLVTDQDITILETMEKKVLESIETPDRFVLPGGCPRSAQLDICRTICRRAERSLVSLIRTRGLQELVPCQRYLNRMSDYLYVLARYADKRWEYQKGEIE
ncbi:MAG: cob(I)yrinic acid a,c-diamide adenosyltransferase [Spirochaetes bacterium]|nr:cob(I)yrinic acid a,c-diamide adenosyltransferase [Spirochaetota bacterium]